MEKRAVLSRGLSIYLDAMRALAAFLVVFLHFSYERFTDGQFDWFASLSLGHDAVIVFFVLSGFVITFAATQKDKTLRRFSFSRLTRLFSVAIPALVLTFFFDQWGLKANPDFYLKSYAYNALPAWEYWLRGLTFTSQWFGENVRLGSNGPYWSLSYEVAYYIAFAILIYLRGVLRILSLVGVCLLFGLKIWLLAPAWIMGVGLYVFLSKVDYKTLTSVTVWLLILSPIVFYTGSQFASLPDVLRGVTYRFMGEVAFSDLEFSKNFLWSAMVGVLFSVHLLGMAILLSTKMDRPKGGFAKSCKWLAGGSFSLYLLHYPVLQWGGAVMPRHEMLWLNYLVLLMITIVICYVAAEIFERPLGRYRAVLKRLFSARSAV